MGVRKPSARIAVLEFPPGLHSLTRVLPSGRSLLIGFALIAGGLAAYAGARGTSIFAVRHVEVEGAPPRVAERVQPALERPLTGESLLSISQADIDHALVGLPDVQAIGFDRSFPRTIRVAIIAERPVAVLRRGVDAWLVSERGRVLRPLPDARPETLPRIWVAELSAPRNGTLLKADDAAQPARALGAVLAAAPAFLKEIQLARLRGSEVELLLRSGVEVRLGPPHELPLKIAVARAVLAAGSGLGGYVDVSVPERPVASDSQVSG